MIPFFPSSLMVTIRLRDFLFQLSSNWMEVKLAAGFLLNDRKGEKLSYLILNRIVPVGGDLQ